MNEFNNDMVNIGDLYRTEWSGEFETYMRNRLVLGSMRYGKLQKGKKPQYDRMREAMKRIKLYLETHNQEFLVDAANFCMCEYIEPSFDDCYFSSIDDGDHAKAIK